LSASLYIFIIAAIPVEQEGFLKEVQEKVERFVQSDAVSLELNRCNAYQRRLIYQITRDKYPGLRHRTYFIRYIEHVMRIRLPQKFS
jgi:R3H domain